MALETATFLSQLVPANPPGSDLKSQGDDHLRLLKSVAQNTFPDASKAFYFPKGIQKTANYSVLEADDNTLFSGDPTSATFTFTLPTMAGLDAGWRVGFFNEDDAGNSIIIAPASGTIDGQDSITLNFRDFCLVWLVGSSWHATIIRRPGNITERLSLTADLTPAAISADVDDYDPTDLSGALILRLSSTDTWRVTGLAGGFYGRVMMIFNVGSEAIILSAEDTDSIAANRFALNQDLYLYPHHAAVLWWDPTSSRWRCSSCTSIAGKETIYFDAGGMIPRTTNGPVLQIGETTTNKVMRVSLLFDPTTNEFAQFKAIAPKNWDGGPITFMVLWSHGATVTNFAVKWGLQGFLITNEGSLETAWGAEIEVIDTGANTDGTYISSESAPMTFAGTPAHPCFWNFQAYRDGASIDDTMTVDAWLLGYVVFYNTKANSDL